MHSSQVPMEYSLKKILSCYDTNSLKVQLIESYSIQLKTNRVKLYVNNRDRTRNPPYLEIKQHISSQTWLTEENTM